MTTKTELMPEGESCTLDELNVWQRGRFLAGEHEAADNVKARFVALAKAQYKGKAVSVERNAETGDLQLTVEK